GKFDDWRDVPPQTDPPNNGHETEHTGKHDQPQRAEPPDGDLGGSRLPYDSGNPAAYFKAPAATGRTQAPADGKPAGRYYAILTIDVDDNDKTGYWLHEGGFYPTSGGYDVNAEIEWYGGRLNTGHYIQHASPHPKEPGQAFLDQSSGQYKKGNNGPYKAGFVRLGPGTYKHYSEWVYHDNGTLTFVRDKGPQTLGVITGALSADGHELEMKVPLKGFLVDPQGRPILALGRKINASLSVEGRWGRERGG